MSLYNEVVSLIRKKNLPRRPLISADLVKASNNPLSHSLLIFSLLDLGDIFLSGRPSNLTKAN